MIQNLTQQNWSKRGLKKLEKQAKMTTFLSSILQLLSLWVQGKYIIYGDFYKIELKTEEIR